MSTRSYMGYLPLLVGVALVVVAGAGLASQPVYGVQNTDTVDATVVVAADGSADVSSIQNAVDSVEDGATIEVRPGTYEESVVIDKTITVVAPDGATLDGSSMDSSEAGIYIPQDTGAEPVIDGLTITGYEDGIVANRTSGAWTLKNVVSQDNGVDGLFAENTTGEWRVLNSTLTDNGDDGISADQSTGAYTIRNSGISNNADEGIDTENTAGDWTIRNSTILENGNDGIDADGGDATASWLLVNSTVRGNLEQGLDMTDAVGDWTIRNTEISGHDTAIMAVRVEGDWTIEGSVIRNQTRTGVRAPGATGDWTISNSYFQFNRVMAINAVNTTGAWTISHTEIQDSKAGVYAAQTPSDWTISHSSFRNLEEAPFDMSGDGTAVYARNTSGQWEIHNSEFMDNDHHAITAEEGDSEGDATQNWWGDESGPQDEDCLGLVDCSEPLSESPTVDSPDPGASQAQAVGGGWFTELEDFGLLPIAIVAGMLSILSGLIVVARRM